MEINYNKNYYEILGISLEASSDEIHKAYHNKMKQYSNDNNVGITQEVAEILKKMTQDINEAKEILLDKNLRAEYDMNIKNNNSKTDEENEESRQEKFRKLNEQRIKQEENKRQFYKNENEKKEEEVKKLKEKAEKNHEELMRNNKIYAIILIVAQLMFYIFSGGGSFTYVSGIFSIVLISWVTFLSPYWVYSGAAMIVLLNFLHGILVSIVYHFTSEIAWFFGMFFEPILYLILVKCSRNNWKKHSWVIEDAKTKLLITDGIMYWVFFNNMYGAFKEKEEAYYRFINIGR